VWDNLLHVVGEYQARSSVYFGRVFQAIIPHGYTSGGAGYVISKPAVRKLVDEGPKFPADCARDGGVEDLDIGRLVLTCILQKLQNGSKIIFY